jgi:hypothetical protein
MLPTKVHGSGGGNNEGGLAGGPGCLLSSSVAHARAALLRSRLDLLCTLQGVARAFVAGASRPHLLGGAGGGAAGVPSSGPGSAAGASRCATLSLDVAGWRATQRARGLPPGPLPEQRLRFILDQADSLAVVWGGRQGSGEEGSAAAAAGGDGGGRDRPLPQWLGLGGALRVVDAAAAARVLEDQIFFEPFARADAWRLLEQGCEVQVGEGRAARSRVCAVTSARGSQAPVS